MTYTEFQNLLVGVSATVTADNVGTPQCVDVSQLVARVLGAPRFTGNAKDIINQAGTSFKQILNTPNNFPQQWDVVVLSGKYNPNPDGSDGPGHVVSCNGRADTNSFDALSQNDPTGSDIELRTYPYEFVIGWLHPVQLPQDGSADLQACLTIHDQLVTQGNEKDTQIAQLTTTQDNLNQQINDRNNDITQLNAQVATIKTQLQASQDQVTTLGPIATLVPQLKEQLSQSESDRSVCLSAQGSQNALISNLRAQVNAKKPSTLLGRLQFLLSA